MTRSGPLRGQWGGESMVDFWSWGILGVTGASPQERQTDHLLLYLGGGEWWGLTSGYGWGGSVDQGVWGLFGCGGSRRVSASGRVCSSFMLLRRLLVMGV